MEKKDRIQPDLEEWPITPELNELEEELIDLVNESLLDRAFGLSNIMEIIAEMEKEFDLSFVD